MGNLPLLKVLQITTAYEQGVGKGIQRKNVNPYATLTDAHTAWNLGYEQGLEHQPITEQVEELKTERDILQEKLTKTELENRAFSELEFEQTKHIAGIENMLKELQAKLTELQKQEPVGEVVEGVGPRLYKLEDRCKWGMPLYASPKALEPLTDEQCDRVMHKVGILANFETIRELIRATEAAHSIGGQPT